MFCFWYLIFLSKFKCSKIETTAKHFHHVGVRQNVLKQANINQPHFSAVRAAFALLRDTAAALCNKAHDSRQKSKSISLLERNQMKMSRRICSILLRNDSIVPFQMQQLVLRAVISPQKTFVLCVLRLKWRHSEMLGSTSQTHNLLLAHTNNATNNDSVSILVALWCTNSVNGGVSEVPNVPILNLLLF